MPSDLSENEIVSRHIQALGECRGACQELGRHADPDYLALKGGHYRQLKQSLEALEGTCRQLSMFREDARWLALGMIYAKTLRIAQRAYVEERWSKFTALIGMFHNGLVQMNDLKDRATGRIGSIIPANLSSFLILPDHTPAVRQRPTRH